MERAPPARARRGCGAAAAPPLAPLLLLLPGAPRPLAGVRSLLPLSPPPPRPLHPACIRRHDREVGCCPGVGDGLLLKPSASTSAGFGGATASVWGVGGDGGTRPLGTIPVVGGCGGGGESLVPAPPRRTPPGYLVLLLPILLSLSSVAAGGRSEGRCGGEVVNGLWAWPPIPLPLLPPPPPCVTRGRAPSSPPPAPPPPRFSREVRTSATMTLTDRCRETDGAGVLGRRLASVIGSAADASASSLPSTAPLSGRRRRDASRWRRVSLRALLPPTPRSFPPAPLSAIVPAAAAVAAAAAPRDRPFGRPPFVPSRLHRAGVAAAAAARRPVAGKAASRSDPPPGGGIGSRRAPRPAAA